MSTIRERLLEMRHACELAGSDHNPMPLQNECLECGFAHPCPTHALATEIREHVEAVIADLDASERPSKMLSDGIELVSHFVHVYDPERFTYDPGDPA